MLYYFLLFFLSTSSSTGKYLPYMRTQDEFELKNKMKYVHKIHFIPSVDQQERNGNCGEAHELEKETKLRQLLNRFVQMMKTRKENNNKQCKKEWRRKNKKKKRTENRKKNAKQRFGSPSRTNRIRIFFLGKINVVEPRSFMSTIRF